MKKLSICLSVMAVLLSDIMCGCCLQLLRYDMESQTYRVQCSGMIIARCTIAQELKIQCE